MQIKTTMRHYLIISYLLERPLSKSQEISIGEDVENKKPFFPLLVSWYTMEDSMEVPQEIKTMIELSYDPENPPLAYTQRKQKQDLQEICALPCPLQHYSQWPRHGNSLFPLMDEWIWKMWHIHNRPKLGHKKRSSCHLHQHGWTLRTFMPGEITHSGKDKYHMIPLI